MKEVEELKEEKRKKEKLKEEKKKRKKNLIKLKIEWEQNVFMT